MQVKELVEDICKVRMSKIYAGLQVLQGPMTVKLNNLSAMECNVVRPFFQGSLGQFQALAGVRASAPLLAMPIFPQSDQEHQASTRTKLLVVGETLKSIVCTGPVSSARSVSLSFWSCCAGGSLKGYLMSLSLYLSRMHRSLVMRRNLHP